MRGNIGGCKRRLTSEERETILSLFVEGKEEQAQALATKCGLASDYAWKLARARGLIELAKRPYMGRNRCVIAEEAC